MPVFVNYASWTCKASIPQLASAGGLVIEAAFYKGQKVFAKATQPFVLVDYHGNPPNPTFKDGLNSSACGQGAGYTALKCSAPNTGTPNVSYNATNDNQFSGANPGGAIFKEQSAKDFIRPARVTVWAKFQVGNYQYVHRWTFGEDGEVHAEVGLGGKLWNDKAHIHNFYFRLDFDITGAQNDRVQRFDHALLTSPCTSWTDILTEVKQSKDWGKFTTWRVAELTPKPNGQLRSFEIVPASEGGPDGTYSTGDTWALVRKSSPPEDGSDIKCKDTDPTDLYVSGQSLSNVDVLVWHVLRSHHLPRPKGEEKDVVPYHFIGFHLQPRDWLDETPKSLYSTTPVSP